MPGSGGEDPGGGLVAVEHGHTQVHQHEVRLQPDRERYRLRAVCRFADHLDIRGRLEQRDDSAADDRMIVGDEHADHAVTRVGSETTSLVPAPGALTISSSPPTRASRSRMPGSPKPDAGTDVSKPAPSSIAVRVARASVA